MTGTAATEADEFSSIYNLAVAVVPTNRTVTRTDNADVVFRTEQVRGRCTALLHQQHRVLIITEC